MKDHYLDPDWQREIEMLKKQLDKAEELICWLGACQDLLEISENVKEYFKEKNDI